MLRWGSLKHNPPLVGFASPPPPHPPLSYLGKQPTVRKGEWKKAARSRLRLMSKRCRRFQGEKHGAELGPGGIVVCKPCRSQNQPFGGAAPRSVSAWVHIHWVS